MKRPLAYIAALLLFLSTETIDPLGAEAGILSGSSTNGLSIRVPRIRHRNVRSTTSVLRATNPSLDNRGHLSYVKIYSKLQQGQERYEQRYYRWAQKKARYEEKLARKQQRQQELRKRKQEKAQQEQLRRSRRQQTNSSTGGGESGTDVAHDPRAWFSQNIMGQRRKPAAPSGEMPTVVAAEKPSGRLLQGKPVEQNAADLAGKDDHTGKEVQVAPKKKAGFWTHVLRALSLG